MAVVGWRDFYLLGGGALATLIGLLFVAMSIHLREILVMRPLTRNLEIACTEFFSSWSSVALC